ncbi:COMM domain-containing protein 3-like [Trichosurus vulpecula]|uniref:COMM domain-containing protein 3-like n=1 Tax=Trichosurus vulpecula TaxID=9337 RepID=UPI00186B2D31|nr:COMM domain-containing protein 3-like [Trichosurus vulpecula]
MELSEYVQRGCQMLADPGCFDLAAFALLVRAAFRSLLEARADEAVLDHPDLKHIDPLVLKHSHAALATCILEAGKQKADKSTLSIGRCPLLITDVSWRLEYQIKTNQLHRLYRPSYLVTLNVEKEDPRSHPDISFNCTMEQLQDLVGKLKDAAKSLERATQM